MTENQFVELVEQRLAEHFQSSTFPFEVQSDALSFLNACRYPFETGGKRFRPRLVFQAAQALGEVPASVCVDFAASVEMIHTYSLVHDDLPCMDNDSIRRGLPTTHAKFGENIGLLVGDTLLTESFVLLGGAYASPLIARTAQLAGLQGMVMGQVVDLRSASGSPPSLEKIEYLHRLKTGALFRLCCEGPAIIGQKTQTLADSIGQIGETFGLAFQIADDILDSSSETENSAVNYVNRFGRQAALERLNQLQQQAFQMMELLPGDCSGLKQIFDQNTQRNI